MKYIKLFEKFTAEAKKSAGETISIEDFKNIKKGDKLLYMGSRFTVLSSDGYALKLKGEGGKVVNVNKAMFDTAGHIGEDHDESVVTEAKNTIGLAFKEEQDYLDFVEFIKDEKGSIKKDFGWDSKTKSWEVIMDVKVLDSIYGEGTPSNKESGWYGGLPGDFESVIIESVVTEASSSDGGDKSNGNSNHEDHAGKTIAQHWKDTYGDDFHSKYPAIAKIVKSRPGIDKRELKRIWDETYGENFEEQYPALWQKID